MRMASLSTEELEEIIKRDLPGYRLVTDEGRSDSADASIADAQTPEEGEAQTHERSSSSTDSASSTDGELVEGDTEAPEAADPDPMDEVDDAIVAVQVEKPTESRDPGDETKAVVVSGKERRVIGFQG